MIFNQLTPQCINLNIRSMWSHMLMVPNTLLEVLVVHLVQYLGANRSDPDLMQDIQCIE